MNTLDYLSNHVPHIIAILAGVVHVGRSNGGYWNIAKATLFGDPAKLPASTTTSITSNTTSQPIK